MFARDIAVLVNFDVFRSYPPNGTLLLKFHTALLDQTLSEVGRSHLRQEGHDSGARMPSNNRHIQFVHIHACS